LPRQPAFPDSHALAISPVPGQRTPVVPQLSERAAEAMAPEQATALVHVLDLQARWENHRDGHSGTLTTTDLHVRQKAFDAFRVAVLNYTAKYPRAVIPEPTQYVVERMVIWCRTLRAVFRRATGGSPDEVLIKVYRLVDRIAARMGKEVVARAPAGDLAAAVRELDVVIAWCDALMLPMRVRRKPGGEASSQSGSASP